MVSYSIGSRGRSRVGLFALALFASIFVTSFLGMVSRGGSLSGALFSLCIAGMVIWNGVQCARQIVRIRITPDGMIRFVRTIGRTDVSIYAITGITGEYVATYHGHVWTMRINRTSGRPLRVHEFDDARDLADRLTALNPSVAVSGLWPMGAPKPRLKATSGYVQAARR